MHGCKKSSPPLPLNYTAKMGGTWHWSGILVHVYVDSTVIPPIGYADTFYVKDTFAVIVIDDRTIRVPNILHDTAFDTTINFAYDYDSTNTIIFGHAGSYLSYNYQVNTMSYYSRLSKDTSIGPGEHDIYLHTP